MIYHWRREAKKRRGDTTPERHEWIPWQSGSQVAISEMLERGEQKRGERRRRRGEEERGGEERRRGEEGKKVQVQQLSQSCHLPEKCEHLSLSLSVYFSLCLSLSLSVLLSLSVSLSVS